MTDIRPKLDNTELVRMEMRDVFEVDTNDLEWDEYRSIWDSLQEIENGVLWGRSLICAAIEVQYGEESIKAFSDDVGIGESTAYGYRRAWLAFPRREDRFPDLSFSHHRIAASTNDPHYWIEDAALHGLSTHALEKKIRIRQQKSKAALVEEQKKALEAGEEIPDPEDVDVKGNHNVPLSPTLPATFSAKEQEVARKELEESCSQWFFDQVEAGYLVSDIVGAMKTVLKSARAGE